jgi:ribonuclease HI
MLRGQRVYARADESGKLLADGGRVEVRYKPNDGRKYQARADNLKVVDGVALPEATCGPAEAPLPKKEEAGTGASPAAGAKGRTTGGRAKKPSVKAAAKASAPESFDPGGAIIAYADGACSGNPGPAGLGVVVLLEAGRRVEVSEYLGVGTNNIAELTAIARALDEVPDRGRPYLIHTDSQYAIGVLSKGWKAKANTELVAEIKERLEERSSTQLRYVPGHSGVPLNERADALARDAVKLRRTQRDELVSAKPSTTTAPPGAVG